MPDFAHPVSPVSVATGPYRRKTVPQGGVAIRDNAGQLTGEYMADFTRAPVRTRLQVWRDGWEMLRLDARRKWESVVERWWRRRQVLRRAACTVLGLMLLVAYAATSFSDPAGFVATARGHLEYVRQGQAGVDFSQPARPLTCAELLADVLASDGQVSMDDVRTAAEDALTSRHGEDVPACVCAPMFGIRRRYLAVNDSRTVHHLYNPTRDADWDKSAPGGRSVASGKSWVTENQRMLVPAETTDVENVRENSVRLTYRTRECKASAVIVQLEPAWCAQACLDLMDGRTVYDVARKHA